MIRPQPCLSMGGAKTLQARRVPVKLVSRMAFQSASSISRVGPFLVRPALLTRISTRPNCFIVSSRSFSRLLRSRHVRKLSVPRRLPIFSISAAVFSTSSTRREESRHVGARLGES